MENNESIKDTKQDYRTMVNQMGKKEFTLLKMQEYGFWPENLPTPYEKQANETKEDFNKRKQLLKEYEKIAEKISDLYKEKNEINDKLRTLRKEYNETWDYEKIRKDVSKKIMQESIERRAERKKQKEIEKIKASEQWNKKKADNIVFIGKGYSNLLFDKNSNKDKLISLGLPIITDDKELANILEIEYKELRFLVYHRDVITVDNYHRYNLPKKKGGVRNIAAPKPVLKKVQRKILNLILDKIEISNNAHGFLKSKSVVSGAKVHIKQPQLLINMDIENFFPTITFQRVRGMFKSFGYSGYISSLLAMLCTYCERIPIEIKEETKYVKTSERLLPQGSPASPMITNIICRNLDERLNNLSAELNFTYTRYADDMSFSFGQDINKIDLNKTIGKIIGQISSIIKDEGFNINTKKTRYLRKNNRQCITGIVINNAEIGVPKKWIKKMRAAIYNANKSKDNGVLSLEIINEISGMASWLIGVNQEKYKNIIDDAFNLLNNYQK